MLALTLDDVRTAGLRGAECVAFDELMRSDLARPAPEVVVSPPKWRGYSFVELLEWLVCARLTAPGSRVTWVSSRSEGATGIERLLRARGWDLQRVKRRTGVAFTGGPPSAAPFPDPGSYTTDMPGRSLRIECDWGVFSRGGVDAGTRLLYTAAAERGPVDSVTDVGTGSGVIALALLASGIARSAIGTEADCVAAYIARRNAVANGLALDVVTEPDPAKLPGSDLTVCYLPTHADAPATSTLIEGLASRGALATVHASLERRYTELFGATGAKAETVARETHVVMDVRKK